MYKSLIETLKLIFFRFSVLFSVLTIFFINTASTKDSLIESEEDFGSEESFVTDTLIQELTPWSYDGHRVSRFSLTNTAGNKDQMKF